MRRREFVGEPEKSALLVEDWRERSYRVDDPITQSRQLLDLMSASRCPRRVNDRIEEHIVVHEILDRKRFASAILQLANCLGELLEPIA